MTRSMGEDWQAACVLLSGFLRERTEQRGKGRPVTPGFAESVRQRVEEFKAARPGLNAKIVEVLDEAVENVRPGGTPEA